MALGVSGAYAPREGEDLADMAERVARTWSPQRLANRVGPGARRVMAFSRIRRTLEAGNNAPQRGVAPDSRFAEMTGRTDERAGHRDPDHGRKDRGARRRLDAAGGRQGQVAPRAGGSRRPAVAHRRAAGRLLRPDLPALLRRAHP